MAASLHNGNSGLLYPLSAPPLESKGKGTSVPAESPGLSPNAQEINRPPTGSRSSKLSAKLANNEVISDQFQRSNSSVSVDSHASQSTAADENDIDEGDTNSTQFDSSLSQSQINTEQTIDFDKIFSKKHSYDSPIQGDQRKITDENGNEIGLKINSNPITVYDHFNFQGTLMYGAAVAPGSSNPENIFLSPDKFSGIDLSNASVALPSVTQIKGLIDNCKNLADINKATKYWLNKQSLHFVGAEAFSTARILDERASIDTENSEALRQQAQALRAQYSAQFKKFTEAVHQGKVAEKNKARQIANELTSLFDNAVGGSVKVGKLSSLAMSGSAATNLLKIIGPMAYGIDAIVAAANVLKSVTDDNNNTNTKINAKKCIENTKSALNSTMDNMGKLENKNDHLPSFYRHLTGHMLDEQKNKINQANEDIRRKIIDKAFNTCGVAMGIGFLVGGPASAGFALALAGMAIGQTIYSLWSAKSNVNAANNARNIEADHLNQALNYKIGIDEAADIKLAQSNPYIALLLLINELGHADPARQTLAKDYLKQCGVSADYVDAFAAQAEECRGKDISNERVRAMLKDLRYLIGDGIRSEVAKKDPSTDPIAKYTLKQLRSKDVAQYDTARIHLKNLGATDTQIACWKQKPKNAIDKLCYNHAVASLRHGQTMQGDRFSGPRTQYEGTAHTPSFAINMLSSKNPDERQYIKDHLRSLIPGKFSEAEREEQVEKLAVDLLNAKSSANAKEKIKKLIGLYNTGAILRKNPNSSTIINSLKSKDPVQIESAINLLSELSNEQGDSRDEFSDAISDIKLKFFNPDTGAFENKDSKEFNKKIEQLSPLLLQKIAYRDLGNNPNSDRLMELLQSKDANESEMALQYLDHKFPGMLDKIHCLKLSTDTPQDIAWAKQELGIMMGTRLPDSAIPSQKWVIRNLASFPQVVNQFLQGMSFLDSQDASAMADSWMVNIKGTYQPNSAKIEKDLKILKQSMDLKCNRNAGNILQALRTPAQSVHAERILLEMVPEEKWQSIQDKLAIWKTPGLSKNDLQEMTEEIEIYLGARTEPTKVLSTEILTKFLRSGDQSKTRFANDYLKSIGDRSSIAKPMIDNLVPSLPNKSDIRFLEPILTLYGKEIKYKSQLNAKKIGERLLQEKSEPFKYAAAQSILEKQGMSPQQIAVLRDPKLKCSQQDIEYNQNEISRVLGVQLENKMTHSAEWVQKTLGSGYKEYRKAAKDYLNNVGVPKNIQKEWKMGLATHKTARDFHTVPQIQTFCSLKTAPTAENIINALNSKKHSVISGLKVFLLSIGHDPNSIETLISDLTQQVEYFKSQSSKISGQDKDWFKSYILFQVGVESDQKHVLPSPSFFRHLVKTAHEQVTTPLYKNLSNYLGVTDNLKSEWLNYLWEMSNDDKNMKKIESYLSLMDTNPAKRTGELVKMLGAPSSAPAAKLFLLFQSGIPSERVENQVETWTKSLQNRELSPAEKQEIYDEIYRATVG